MDSGGKEISQKNNALTADEKMNLYQSSVSPSRNNYIQGSGID